MFVADTGLFVTLAFWAFSPFLNHMRKFSKVGIGEPKNKRIGAAIKKKISLFFSSIRIFDVPLHRRNVGGRNRKLRVPIYNIRTLYNKHIKN